MIPVVGDGYDLFSAAIGKDLIAGESLSGAARVATALGTLAGSGRGARNALEAADAGADAVSRTARRATARAAREEFDRVVRPNYWRRKASENPDAFSEADLSRMGRGQAPIGPDGHPIELHHRIPLSEGGTNDPSNLVEMSRTDHRLGENYKRNHPEE